MHKIKVENSGHGCRTQIFVDDFNIAPLTRAATLKLSTQGVPILELECLATDLEVSTDAVVFLRAIEDETKFYDAKNTASKTLVGIWLPSSNCWGMDALGYLLHWEIEKLPVAMASLMAFRGAQVMIFGADGEPLPLPEK